MASMEKQLLEFLEFKTRAEKLDPNNTANGHGIFNVLSQTVLWGNETADNIKLILALIHSLKAKIPPVLEKLETRSKKFGTAMRELIEDCKWSVTQITINPDFYRCFIQLFGLEKGWLKS